MLRCALFALLILVRAADPPPPTSDALARYRQADAYSRAHHSLVLIVLEGDEIVFDDYQYDYAPHVAHALYSGTKSFSCAIAAAAVDDRLLDLDERVGDTIPEFASDPDKVSITVRQLLSLSSGLDPGSNLLWASADVDKYALALTLDVIAPPGTQFAYGPSHLFVFGALMRRKLELFGENPLDYLSRRVFDPIGLEVTAWRRDGAGNPYIPSGAFLSAPEWAKFGVLLKDGGVWAGERILSAEVLQECFQGTAANPAYGLTFWLNNYVPDALVVGEEMEMMFPHGTHYIYEDGPADIIVAVGSFNQRMYIIPSRDLVVVRFGWADPTWEDAAFLACLLDGCEAMEE